MNILLAGKKAEFFEQAEKLLGECDGLEMDRASSNEEFMNFLGSKDYDAVVACHEMPEIDGIEFLETVIEKNETVVPFIFFPEEFDKRVMKEALSWGLIRELRDEKPSGFQSDSPVDLFDEQFLEERFEEAKTLFNVLTCLAPESIFGIDSSGNVIFANRKASEALGYSLEELEDMKVFDYDSKFSRDNWDEHWEGVSEESSVRIESEHVRKNGEVFPVELLINPIRVGGEEYHITFARDITERKEYYERLEGEKALLGDLLGYIPDTIYFMDKDHRFLQVSQSFANLMDMERDDLIGKDDFDLFPEEQAEEAFSDEERIIETGEPLIRKEELITTPDGEDHWFSVTKVPRKNEEGDIVGIAGLSREITERKSKSIEEELKFRNNLLESLLENIPDKVYFKDDDARFVEVSRAKADEVGEKDRENLVGNNDFDYESGEQAEKMYEDDMRVIREEESIINKEEKVTTPEGEEWVSATKVPRYDEEGNVVGMLGISRDITERKEAEEREEFLHSLLRHDVRNKAQMVRGYHELMEEYDLPDEVESYLEKADMAVRESLDLIEKVRALRGVGEEEEIGKGDVGKIIERVVDEEEPRASNQGIEIMYDYIDLKVKGGPLLEELFSNLIVNSIMHSNCGKIRISGEKTEDEVIVRIEDDGVGLPEEQRERVFEKGFKRGKNAGSGLGLYLVKQIAENYGGDIQLKDSELGGARFDVHLQAV